jgi:hypothetical protein
MRNTKTLAGLQAVVLTLLWLSFLVVSASESELSPPQRDLQFDEAWPRSKPNAYVRCYNTEPDVSTSGDMNCGDGFKCVLLTPSSFQEPAKDTRGNACLPTICVADRFATTTYTVTLATFDSGAPAASDQQLITAFTNAANTTLMEQTCDPIIDSVSIQIRVSSIGKQLEQDHDDSRRLQSSTMVTETITFLIKAFVDSTIVITESTSSTTTATKFSIFSGNDQAFSDELQQHLFAENVFAQVLAAADGTDEPPLMRVCQTSEVQHLGSAGVSFRSMSLCLCGARYTASTLTFIGSSDVSPGCSQIPV